MKVKQDFLYVVYRNGKPYRHFAAKLNAFMYLAACADLDPASSWEVRYKVVSGDA